MRKKNIASATCLTCDTPVIPEEVFEFSFNEESYYFCDSHALPFKMGLSIGQMEINSKFVSYLDNLPEPITKNDVRKALLQFTPMTKLQPASGINHEEFHINNAIETPKQLFDAMGKTVIGQEIARQAVSVSVINHIQALEDIGPTSQPDKHHVLMLGKSGSGKTLIARTVAELFDFPFVMGDATNYSPTGFQGSDAESVVQDLLLDTDMNFELAEHGMVFIDEIDKICSAKIGNTAIRHEAFMGSTQSTLLKLIEGKVVKIPGPAYGDPPGTSCNLSTERMLFFFGGAFNGLSDIIAKKMGLKNSTLGFKKSSDLKNKEIDEALKSYEIFSLASREEMVESLIEYGMLSEMVGRIPTIAPLKPLSKEDLMKVLLESSTSPIEKQKSIFEKSGYIIQFTEEFLKKIVDLSYHSATGTRALDSYIKKAVSMASFDLLTLSKNKIAKGDIIITEHCATDPSRYEKSKLHISSGTIIIPASMSTSIM